MTIFKCGKCGLSVYPHKNNCLNCKKTLCVVCCMKEKNMGVKFDIDKPKYKEIFTFLDWDFLLEMTQVMKKGSEKYGFENWKKDLDKTRIENALIRHCKAYLEGEILDKESGKSHLLHIACNTMFLKFYDSKVK